MFVVICLAVAWLFAGVVLALHLSEHLFETLACILFAPVILTIIGFFVLLKIIRRALSYFT